MCVYIYIYIYINMNTIIAMLGFVCHAEKHYI